VLHVFIYLFIFDAYTCYFEFLYASNTLPFKGLGSARFLNVSTKLND